jgi:hypothetical protein
MQIRKEGYTHSVEAVATELLTPNYSIDRFPFVGTYLPLLRSALDPKQRPGRDEMVFSHYVLSLVKPHIERHTYSGIDSVPMTVAVAIHNGEQALEVGGLHPFFKRFLFDLFLGVAVDDYTHRKEHTARNAAYDNNFDDRRNLLDYTDNWKAYAEYYRTFQGKLRQVDD